MANEPSSSSTTSSNGGGGSASAARAAARGTMATLVLRLVSFLCTQWTFRILDPATLGRASVQLELISTTILFLSREGFRLSLTRNVGAGADDDKFDKNWNVAWLSIPVSTVVSLLAFGLHMHRAPADDADFRLGGGLYCLAAWIEGLAEPAVLLCLRRLHVATRVSAEGLATVCKTLATVVALHHIQGQDRSVSAFGVAQMVYALVYFTFLYSKTWADLMLSPRLRPRLGLKHWDMHTCYMTVVFTVQGFFKHLLTEGDRIVLTTLSGSYDQGIYAMGSAYGGLAARIILQPLEENARLLWSRLASEPAASANSSNAKKNGKVDPLELSYVVLVKLVLFVGLTFSFLGVNYTSILLNILAGRRWGGNPEAAAVLSAFCVYTSALALNGMTEAFVYGVTTSAGEIRNIGLAHTAVGVVFYAASTLMVARYNYGTIGLVAANCLAMLLRSMYSINYAAMYFAKRRNQQAGLSKASLLFRSLLPRMFPQWSVLAAYVFTFLATRASLGKFEAAVAAEQGQVLAGSKAWFVLALQHITVGVACLCGVAGLAYTVELDFRQSLRTMLREKQD